ncbi:MAG: RNase adapter RapZ [Lachnospiraceae bacterium]
MNLVIVTGLSGAGKTTALRQLEDEGYYCVDNLPVSLVDKFVELSVTQGEYENIALGMDIRSGSNIALLPNVLDSLKEKKYNYRVLFLEASDETLVKRYKETRRVHPLAKDKRVDSGILEERVLLKDLKDRADYIIDTTHMLTRELKLELEKIFVGNEQHNNLFVTILSFGFKYGIPVDADLVFDVRFLPNPFYIDELKPLTGNDKPVQDFVMASPTAGKFLDKLGDMIDFLLPNYVLEGKNSLVIAIGCTGGKHRSVTLANALYGRLSGGNYGVKIDHRDILK